VIVLCLALTVINAKHTFDLWAYNRDLLFEFPKQCCFDALPFFDPATWKIPCISVGMANERYAVVLIQKNSADADGSRLGDFPNEASRLAD